MQTKEDVIACCMQLTDVYEDYPFHDSNWAVLRHKGNKKIFACDGEYNDTLDQILG